MVNLDAWDVFAVVGGVLLFSGLWLLAPWAALTVCGAILLILGLYGAMR